MANAKYDVVIIGGGIVGCATAFYLAKGDDRIKVAVFEKDPTHERSSTALSLANIRVQFSLEQNIRASLFAMKTFEHFEEEMEVDGEKPFIAYRQEGNLFLFEESSRGRIEQEVQLQRSLDGSVEILSPEEISSRYPLYNSSGMAGTFGAKDGHVDALAVMAAYKRKSKSLGVEFMNAEVAEVLVNGQNAAGVCLASGEKIESAIVINCAGAWAGRVAKTAGVEIPVEPVRRQVYVLDPTMKPDRPLPLTLFPSGLYFRSESSGTVVLGKSMMNDPVGFDFSWDEGRFERELWPELVGFVPAFDSLKLTGGWAGLYAENRFDGNAIIGEWPELKGFYLANGFSGHGLQQAPAVGRYLSELILDRRPSLDLSVFSPKRILEDKPLSEQGLI